MKVREMTRRGALTGVSSLALCAAGLVGLASPALADSLPGPGQPGAPTSGSITVHKYAGTTVEKTGRSRAAGAAGNVRSNGAELDGVDRHPLAGIPFSVSAVGVGTNESCDLLDLSDSANWDSLPQLASGDLPAGYCSVPVGLAQNTDADGVTTFAGLPLGLYLVTEGESDLVQAAVAPFLVTVPYPSTEGTGPAATNEWLYDVHVYPKNQILGSGSKVMTGTGSGLGSLTSWTITSRPLGSYDDGAANLTAYVLSDPLADQLEYAPGTSELSYQTPGGSVEAVDPSYATFTDNELRAPTYTFTPEGLAWLATLPAGTQFIWDLQTAVIGVTTHGGIANRAYENTGTDDVEIGHATTFWGEARLLKQDSSTSAPLAGAQFQVFNANEDQTCEGELGDPVEVNGSTMFASDENGEVFIAGLYTGDDYITTPGRPYCVVETKAPAGYVLDSAPVQIFVGEGTMPWGYVAMINNVKQDGPNLPLTGAQGTLLLSLGGLALVAIASGLYLVQRRRSNQ
ncbi:SpaH/EbpB family LPXTG-anchored major pilin [Actinomyces sp. F1_1611]